MPGTKSSDRRSEDDVPGRHYAIGHAIYTPPLAYCLIFEIFVRLVDENKLQTRFFHLIKIK